MSQVLASTRMPVPNVLPGFIGDHGTLFIKTGKTFHIWNGHAWQPDKVGYTPRELWKAHKCRPPGNLEDGWAGVCHTGPCQQNWTKRDLRRAMKNFMDEHKHEYAIPDGQCWDPLKKGRLLKRNRDQAAVRLQQQTEHLIVKAPSDLLEYAGIQQQKM